MLIKVNRSISLMPILLLLPISLLLTACSSISYDTYYSPATNGKGEKIRAAEVGHEHVGFATGPNDTLLLNIEGLKLDISTNDLSSRVVMLGPFVFPVVPAVPFWFKSYDIRDTIELRTKFTHDSKRVFVDYQKIELRLDGKGYFPKSVKHYPSGVFLEYDLPSMGPDQFTVHINKAKVGRDTVAIPVISFSKAGGWVMDSAP